MSKTKIKNFLIQILSYFILSKRKRKKFRKNHKYISLANNNKILFVREDGTEKLIKHKIENLNITFSGKNNTLKISDIITNSLNICFAGNDSIIEIYGKNSNLNLYTANNCSFTLEKNSYMTLSKIHMDDNNCKVHIGKNCAISWNTTFMPADAHTILENSKITNHPKPIIIGDHVWIGCNTSFTKGVTIASNNIIGMQSIVTKSFLTENNIIAGNPAKIIRKNITWNIDAIYKYQEKLHLTASKNPS